MRERKGTPVSGERKGAPAEGRQRRLDAETSLALALAAGRYGGGIAGKTCAQGFEKGFLDSPAAQGIAGAGDSLAGMEGARRGRRGIERFQINA